jgi:CRISPR/Cas system-associated exonuclease Cas4 (RecB family)
MHGVLHDLRTAHVSHHDPEADLAEVWANIQVWIEQPAVQLESDHDQGGVQLLDAQAACYGSFTSVTIVGLIEKDWPQQGSRSIFYPSLMLEKFFQFSLVSEKLPESSQVARNRAERARFRDLLGLSTDQLRLSSFTLDHLDQDALVNPSTFIEKLEVEVSEVDEEAPSTRIKIDEALMLGTVDPSVVQEDAATWLSLRLATNDLSGSKRSFRHEDQSEGITFSPTRVERYLACPFKYFAGKELGLEEEREEFSRVSPLDRGTWLHKILQEFYRDWQEAINAENIDLALDRCARVMEEVLTTHETAKTLPQAERALERSLFLGSIAKRGLIDRVLRFDAEQDLAVVKRLLEHELNDKFKFKSSSGTRSVSLHAIVDRIDLLQDNTFRVVDYKLGSAPNPKLAVQLPIYAVCTEQYLADRRTDGPWKVKDAYYLAFKKEGLAAPMVKKGELEQALDDGQQRFLDAVDGISQQEFPVRPAEPFNCKYCGYSTVCRKEYVEDS